MFVGSGGGREGRVCPSERPMITTDRWPDPPDVSRPSEIKEPEVIGSDRSTPRCHHAGTEIFGARGGGLFWGILI